MRDKVKPRMPYLLEEPTKKCMKKHAKMSLNQSTLLVTENDCLCLTLSTSFFPVGYIVTTEESVLCTSVNGSSLLSGTSIGFLGQ